MESLDNVSLLTISEQRLVVSLNMLPENVYRLCM